ncbi:hypothetical protein pipiens_007790 [Culex pipiens pipiens]|uniref:C2H2-type domain-containing protein n=1 Tax=Culex pipiens pipiens TaxID=38569 RepID=A0ABD1DKD5_CULPP
MKPKKYKCKDCDKSFAAWKSLTMHNHIHKGLTKCPICGAVLSRTANLKRHMKLKHEVKPDMASNKWSQCQICKLVITSVNLWRHMRTQHTNQEPKRCNRCNKKFKNKYSLREHVRMAHENKTSSPGASTSQPQTSQSLPQQPTLSTTTAIRDSLVAAMGPVLDESGADHSSGDVEGSAAGLAVLSAAQLAAAATMKLF